MMLNQRQILMLIRQARSQGRTLDLRGADLVGVDLKGADMSRVDERQPV
jgi:uncharacterized protein YjbI with pentapeptide repeats